MSSIVFAYNHGDTDFIDSCAGEQICIKPNEFKPMTWDMAMFFIGDESEEDIRRVSFRRGGIAPTLRIFDSMETAGAYRDFLATTGKSGIETTADGEPVISTTVEGEKTIVRAETADSISLKIVDNLVPSGKFMGQRWDDVLSETQFDARYWAIALRVTKGISDDRTLQIVALLEKKKAEEAGKNGNSSRDINSDK